MLNSDERTPLLGDDQHDATRQVRGAAQVDENALAVDSPLNWSEARKWWTVVLLAYSSFCVTFGCLWVVPLATSIIDDLDNINHKSSPTHRDGGSAAVILVSIWELGEAVGPLLIGPLSETFGRLPLYMAANMVFTLATALGAVSDSVELLTASRALTGLAVATNVLNPAVVGDIFPPEQRGAAMSCITIAPLLASAVAPMTSSLVNGYMGWRAVAWLGTMLSASGQVMFVVFFRETYRPRVVAFSEVQRLVCHSTEEQTLMPVPVKITAPEVRGKVSELLTSVARPFVVFFGSGVLISLSVFGAVCYSYFYIISTTLPNILEQVYGFAPGTTGWAFCSNAIGTMIGVSICHRNLDRIYIKLATATSVDGGANNNDNDYTATIQGQPEYRLPLTIIGVLTLPPAVSLYGWSATLHLPLPVFLLSLVWLRASMTLAALPLMSYIVDACGLYAASALTGAIVTRCLAGASMPLATAELIRVLGYGWGFTVMAGVNLAVGMVPVMLFRFGERWRARSVYTSAHR